MRGVNEGEMQQLLAFALIRELHKDGMISDAVLQKVYQEQEGKVDKLFRLYYADDKNERVE